MDPNKPTFESDDAEIDKDNPLAREANELLLKAGSRLKPLGTEYAGAFAVHFYQVMVGDKRIFQMGIQTMVDNVGEGFCDHGLKKIRARLMDHYGRKEK